MPPREQMNENLPGQKVSKSAKNEGEPSMTAKLTAKPTIESEKE